MSPWFTTARSGTPSAFKSPVAIATGVVPTEKGEFGASARVTLPAWSTELNKIETLFEFLFTTARSTSGALPFVLVVKFLIRKFALTIATGFDSLIVPVLGSLKGEPGNSVNVPSPFPRKERWNCHLDCDGEVQKTVTVEVRDDHGAWIRATGIGKPGSVKVPRACLYCRHGRAK